MRLKLDRATGKLATVAFHSSFDELDRCAQTCASCRVFRQALILEQVSSNDLAYLKEANGTLEVSLKLLEPKRADCEFTFEIWIKGPFSVSHSASVPCSNIQYFPGGNTTQNDNPQDQRIFRLANQWLRNCDKNHVQCGNLHWSSSNPTRLVRIISDTEVQLVEAPQEGKRVPYLALSYCWGEDKMNEDEKLFIFEGKTRRFDAAQGRANLDDRLQSFKIQSLPGIIQDAIRLTKHLSLTYFWADTLCIIQDDPEDLAREAPNMHKVYGNAYLTVCACSPDKATESLFQPRSAFKYGTEAAKLGKHWLVNFDSSLNTVRLRSPLSSRGWTLQEEKLSPRILYWTTQRMWWSCAKSELAEFTWKEKIDRAAEPVPAPSTAGMGLELTPPQAFLLSSWNGNSLLLHQQWQDVLQSYVRRYLGRPEDRFRALSGIASVYAQGQQDQYLAGLWKKTFMIDLAWSVWAPADQTRTLRGVAPSWSWASLPMGTQLRMKRKAQGQSSVTAVLTDIDNDVRKDTNPLSVVEAGSKISKVSVRARIRRLLSSDSKHVEWNSISRVDSENREKFSFAEKPEQPVHAVDFSRGLILAYSARKREIIARLDYLQDATRLRKLPERCSEIFCLELAEGEMLLLERVDEGTYSRIGISLSSREDFFEGSDVETISLK